MGRDDKLPLLMTKEEEREAEVTRRVAEEIEKFKASESESYSVRAEYEAALLLRLKCLPKELKHVAVVVVVAGCLEEAAA